MASPQRLDCLVVPPKVRHTATVIFLHVRGARTLDLVYEKITEGIYLSYRDRVARAQIGYILCS